MIDPKDNPEFQHHDKHQDEMEQESKMRQKLRSMWRERMHSRLIRMSRGAQNFWGSLPWAHGDNWRRKNKKK